MSNILNHRRRTMSYHIPRTSPLAGSSTVTTASGTLASLASSLGVSFGRKKKGDGVNATVVSPTTAVEVDSTAAGAKAGADRTEPSASDMLKRF